MRQTQKQLIKDEVCEDCVMPMAKETLIDNGDGSSTLMCVKCPFCKEIVNAHMTKKSIGCPKCEVVVTY